MTREEAIKRLEWLRMVGNHVDSVTLGKEDMPHFDMAIAALMEQEERSEKCKVCNGSKYSKPSPLKRLDRETGEWVYMGSFPESCPVCGRRLEEV